MDIINKIHSSFHTNGTSNKDSCPKKVESSSVPVHRNLNGTIENEKKVIPQIQSEQIPIEIIEITEKTEDMNWHSYSKNGIDKKSNKEKYADNIQNNQKRHSRGAVSKPRAKVNGSIPSDNRRQSNEGLKITVRDITNTRGERQPSSNGYGRSSYSDRGNNSNSVDKGNDERGQFGHSRGSYQKTRFNNDRGVGNHKRFVSHDNNQKNITTELS